jgi:hypothetical protein
MAGVARRLWRSDGLRQSQIGLPDQVFATLSSGTGLVQKLFI